MVPRQRDAQAVIRGTQPAGRHHFMFGPDWEAGCPHCSFWADNFNGIDVHLAHRDVTFVAIPTPSVNTGGFRQRMGWSSSGVVVWHRLQ